MENNNKIVEEISPTEQNKVASFNEKTKKASKGMIWGMACLAILAVGGVGFGVWAMLDKNQNEGEVQVSENDNQVIEPVETNNDKEIDNDLAQNLIDPYLVSFSFGRTVFEEGFDENSKAITAFLSLNYVFFGVGTYNKISYDSLNSTYQHLFGNDEEIGKQDYQKGYYTLTYKADSNNAWNDQFSFDAVGGGGTGGGPVTVVKDAFVDDKKIIVEVYHDVLGVCDDNYPTDKPCFVDGTDYDAWVNDIKDELPVYSMTFRVNDGHYVLKNIEKNN